MPIRGWLDSSVPLPRPIARIAPSFCLGALPHDQHLPASRKVTTDRVGRSCFSLLARYHLHTFSCCMQLSSNFSAFSSLFFGLSLPGFCNSRHRPLFLFFRAEVRHFWDLILSCRHSLALHHSTLASRPLVTQISKQTDFCARISSTAAASKPAIRSQITPNAVIASSVQLHHWGPSSFTHTRHTHRLDRVHAAFLARGQQQN